MHDNTCNDQQSRQTQILPYRTRSSRQSNTTGYEDMERSNTTHPASGGRRLIKWSIGKIINELRKHAADGENLEDDYRRQREKLNQQETSLLKLQDALAEASRTISDYERKHAEAQRANTEAKRAHAEARQEQAEAQRARAEHTREHDREVSVLRNEVYQLEKEKAASRAVANSTKVSDTVILDIWKRMAYNIRSLANTVLTRCPAEEELASDCRQNNELALKTTSGEYRLLADDNTRSAVVEYYIWRSIICCVFGTGHQSDQSGAWGGMAGIKFHAICRILLSKMNHETVTEFVQWRSQGASIIERAMGSQDEVLVQLASREHRRLLILLPMAKKRDKAIRHALQSDLVGIFVDATALQSIFMKSRAIFRVDWVNFQMNSPKEKVSFKPENMEAEIWGDSLGAKSVVLFCISPGLSKAGTADGVGYDQVALLVKPRVICN